MSQNCSQVGSAATAEEGYGCLSESNQISTVTFMPEKNLFVVEVSREDYYILQGKTL